MVKVRMLGGALALLMLAGFLAAGCGDDGDGTADGGGLERVSATLGWLANGTFAPIFVAQEEGFFADEGLNVDIRQGGPAVGVELVANGQFDFMYATVDDVPLGIPQGLDIRSVAVLAHLSPSAIIVPGDSPIQSPEDLEGRSVGDADFSASAREMPAFFEAAGVDASQVEVVNMDPGLKRSALFSGQVDAIGGFMTNEWIRIRAEDPDVRAFPYSDYGVGAISAGIITRNELINEKPDVVRGFVRAIMRAVAWSAENPEMAIEHAASHYPENFEDQAVGVGELQEFLKLMETPDTEANGIGYSTPEEWETLADLLTSTGDLEPGDVLPVDSYFTNEFLPEEPINLPS